MNNSTTDRLGEQDRVYDVPLRRASGSIIFSSTLTLILSTSLLHRTP